MLYADYSDPDVVRVGNDCEGRWIGAKLGPFCLGASASAALGYANID